MINKKKITKIQKNFWGTFNRVCRSFDQIEKPFAHKKRTVDFFRKKRGLGMARFSRAPS